MYLLIFLNIRLIFKNTKEIKKKSNRYFQKFYELKVREIFLSVVDYFFYNHKHIHHQYPNSLQLYIPLY